MSGIAAAMISNYLRREEEKEHEIEEKERKQKKLIAKNLLLNGGNEFMEIGTKETVLTIKVMYTEDYRGRTNYQKKWCACVNEEEIIENNVETCFQTIIQKCKAKSVQVIPFGVDKNYGFVNVYILMLIIDDVKKIRQEAALKELDDRLTEEIRTAW